MIEVTTVTVCYHCEDGRWWAESVDLPGFVAGADTFEEARRLAREGLEFAYDEHLTFVEYCLVLDERSLYVSPPDWKVRPMYLPKWVRCGSRKSADTV